ncbi:uracil-DNA glycosylase [Maudiozyma humilis]|uniref:Uracil-DNA glycosylase n=1 Tax=Maudiozyma humilis TaxID=51915 RepID=A0AAV5RSA2_MAUHU|nr:uracil-DNA glycosylase [Kazachstania humilis]
MSGVKRKRVSIEDFFKKDTGVKRVRRVTKATAVEPAAERVPQPVDTKVSLSSFKQTYAKEKLSPEQRELLALELDTLEDSWFEKLSAEFTKPYFLGIKSFLANEHNAKKATVFPPKEDVYSWSRLTPFADVRVVVIGQDPYHNFNQAHGLAFSVKKPTPAPPSLKNIYKELKNNYPDFQADNRVGDLTSWSRQGVLLLNTALTVRAHQANSHAKCGWSQFTRRVVELLIEDRGKSGDDIVFLLWGNNAIKLVEGLLGQHKTAAQGKNVLVLKSVHPSPLSASRGFFNNGHFRKINEWLYERHHRMIDWSVVPGATLEEVQKKNAEMKGIETSAKEEESETSANVEQSETSANVEESEMSPKEEESEMPAKEEESDTPAKEE